MKKASKIILIAVFLLCILTGCYKQDTVISVNPLGGIKIEMSMTASDEGISNTFGTTFDDLNASMIPQIRSMIEDVSKERVDAIEETVGDTTYKGLKFTGYFPSLSELYESNVYSQMVFQYSATPIYMEQLSTGEGDVVGVALNEEKGFFGTKYTADGTIDFQFAKKALGAQEGQEAKSLSNLTVKFPVGAFTASEGNKNFIMPTFSYSVTSEGEPAVVNFSVFMPNYLAVLGILVFIGLIVTVIILAGKIKKLKAIINGEVTEETTEEKAEEFISADDENFFEKSDETVEFSEETTVEKTEETTETEENSDNE